MLKLQVLLLLVSVTLFAKAQQYEGGSNANYNAFSQKEGTKAYKNGENVRNNENKNENENWNVNENGNANRNENQNGNESGSKNVNGNNKCNGESNSIPTENILERLTNAGEYEIIGYLYPYPQAQPYYYELPIVYEK